MGSFKLLLLEFKPIFTLSFFEMLKKEPAVEKEELRSENRTTGIEQQTSKR